MNGRRLLASVLVALGLARWGTETISLADPPADPNLPRPNPDPAGSNIRRTLFDTSRNAFNELQTSTAEVHYRIKAQVNGIPIFHEEIKEACYAQLVATLSLPEPQRVTRQREILDSELQKIIDREVVLQDAYARLSKNGTQYLERVKAAASREFEKRVRDWKKRFNLKTDEELKNFMRSSGQSLEGIRRQFERDFIAQEYLRSRVFPAVERIGREQIVEYYTQHPNEYQTVDSVQWQDIFIDAGKYRSRPEARQFAEQIAARLRTGEDIAAYLKFDNGDSAYRKGEGLGRHRGEIRPPEAEPVLFQLKDGVVGPLIENPTGYHVVRVIKREYAGQIPLDEKTQKEIRRKLQNLVFEKEMKRLIADLRQHASIEVASD